MLLMARAYSLCRTLTISRIYCHPGLDVAPDKFLESLKFRRPKRSFQTIFSAKYDCVALVPKILEFCRRLRRVGIFWQFTISILRQRFVDNCSGFSMQLRYLFVTL